MSSVLVLDSMLCKTQEQYRSQHSVTFQKIWIFISYVYDPGIMIMVTIMIIMITAMLWHCTALSFCTANNHNPYTYTEVIHICLSTLRAISLSPVTWSAIKDKHIFKQSSSILDVALCYYSPYCLEMYIKKPGKNILTPSHSCICGCHSPVFFFLMILTFIIIMGL